MSASARVSVSPSPGRELDGSPSTDSQRHYRALKILTLQERQRLPKPSRCPTGHHLQQSSLNELRDEKFHFALGGFFCSRCQVHSDNLTNKQLWRCAPCSYFACSMCARELAESGYRDKE
mmetsp:Transcript_6327/g.13698  ORF Transcript_6327/g.13698 Transcript_6327/m.13698 type:complete len:120 (+) Transcript_6327:37-396(+)